DAVLLLLLWLTPRTLRQRRRAIHDADGGVRRRRLHHVGVLVLCVRLARLWLLRPRAAGRAVVYMGRVRLRMRPTFSRWLCGIEQRHTGRERCAVRSKGRKAKKVAEFDVGYFFWRLPSQRSCWRR
ncbi:hypothetical protein B0H14DRAFT_2747896, partial [Mycena olivaceomarginata]